MQVIGGRNKIPNVFDYCTGLFNFSTIALRTNSYKLKCFDSCWSFMIGNLGDTWGAIIKMNETKKADILNNLA